jgi:hypothetical protein
MSPQVEWNFEDDGGPRTLKTPPKRSPRWRRWIAALVIVLGAALGAIYFSIPEAPPPLPQLTPLPTSTPPPIDLTIDQESHALAAGDLNSFRALQDVDDPDWSAAQVASFQAWGFPPVNTLLYTIVDSGTLPSGRRWIDIIQWRGEDVGLRQLRFYRLENNRWLRTRPDLSFWSGEQDRMVTPYFDVIYPQEDAVIAGVAAYRFQQVYGLLCIELGCPVEPSGRWSRAITTTLLLTPAGASKVLDTGQALTVTLPSLRLTGIAVYSSAAGDPIMAAAYDSLLIPIARIASGDIAHWLRTNDGEVFFQAIVNWERQRLQTIRDLPIEGLSVESSGGLVQAASAISLTQTQRRYIDLLSGQQLVPLKSLWHWPLNVPPDSRLLKLIQTEAGSCVAFIEADFGAPGVVKFLNALGASDSFQSAIASSLKISYDDFEQRWLKWLDRSE